jgi:phage major head subunit gpT-like protein
MAIAGFEAKLSGARTRFEAVSSQLFNGDVGGSWGAFTMERTLTEGGSYALIDTGQTGIMRQWIGDKQYDSFRLYRKDVQVVPYEKTFKLQRRELIEDTTDAIQQKIDSFVAAQAQVFDYKVWEKFLTNPTGIDGAALISDTHPFGSSTTWDNKTTDALTYASYNAGRVAMRSLKGEAGRFMGVRPTHLFVGPALERLAKEITGADRPVVYTTAGAEAASGTANSAIVRTNVFQGDVQVVIVEHFANGTNDNDWVLLDASKGVMPMCLVRQRDLESIEQTDMTSPKRFENDAFVWSVEADFGVDGAYPHVIYGKLS